MDPVHGRRRVPQPQCRDVDPGGTGQSTSRHFAFPLRHYILGLHDERAYYWPEHHVRLFRRGAVTFSRTVHAGLVRHSERGATVAPEEGVCIHHLSHPDVSGWIEKANRYTSRPERAGITA